MKFTDVISRGKMLDMYDDFHHKMTGEYGYGMDEHGKGDEWLDFRDKLILSCKQGVIDEKSDSEEYQRVIEQSTFRAEESISWLIRKLNEKGVITTEEIKGEE